SSWRSYHAPPASWPAAQTATASLSMAATAGKPLPLTSGPSAGSRRAGDLPVWVGPPDVTSSRTSGKLLTSGPRSVASASSTAVSRVRVSMASHSVAAAAGVHGVVFSVARADGNSAAGRVHVSLSYSSFAHSYGDDYASRLRLMELPDCALTTPQVAACRKQ